MGGYAYAAGNPVTKSDPTGLRTDYASDAPGSGCPGTAQDCQAYINSTEATGSGTGQAAAPDAATVGGPVYAQQPWQGPAFAPGCSGRVLQLGACPSEPGAAGTTPDEVKQSLIGAASIIGGSLFGPLADISWRCSRCPSTEMVRV
jgi:hypothetical protein